MSQKKYNESKELANAMYPFNAVFEAALLIYFGDSYNEIADYSYKQSYSNINIDDQIHLCNNNT